MKQISYLVSLALIIWLPAFIKPYPVIISNSNIFTDFLFSSSPFNQPLLSTLLGFSLLLFEAFLVSSIYSKHQLTHSNSFLSGFLFVLFLSRTPDHLSFHPALVALLLLILGLKKLLENFKATRSYNLLLSTSIFFSLASLFIPSVLLLFPVLWISLILFQSINWRSIPISIIGLLTPYFFIAIGYLWFDKSILFVSQIEALLKSLFVMPQMPINHEFIELFISATLLFFATSYIFPRIGSQVISIRKKTSFIFWFLGFSIIISFFNSNLESREIVFIPFAGVLAFYFGSLKKPFWADLFISLIFILILFQNYRILFYA